MSTELSPRKGFAVIMIEFDDPHAVNDPERWDAAYMKRFLKAGVEQLVHSMGKPTSHQVSVDHFRCIITNYGWHDHQLPHEVLFAQHWGLDHQDKEESLPSAVCSCERDENIHLSTPYGRFSALQKLLGQR